MRAGIEEGEFQVGGLRLRHLSAGPRDGRPALLLHGFPEGAESWLGQLEALGAAGYRAVAPDLRGYGGSDCPQAVEEYGLDRLVADVEGMAGQLGGPVHLAGHDWGAIIGWATVARKPEIVRSWAALSVPHPAPLAAAVRDDPDQQRRSAYIALFLQTGKAEEVLSSDGYARLRAVYRAGPNPDAVPDRVVERYVESLARPGRLTAALSYYRANLGIEGAWSRLGASTPAIRTPTILVWGDQDPALGRRAVEDTGAHMAGHYTLEIMEGAGHWLQFERPSEVSRCLVKHFDSQ